MAASNQSIADAARDSLARILATDSAMWSEGERRQQMIEVDRLESIITKFEAKAARSGGRRVFSPIARVDA
jgi:hypothetical protein